MCWRCFHKALARDRPATSAAAAATAAAAAAAAAAAYYAAYYAACAAAANPGDDLPNLGGTLPTVKRLLYAGDEPSGGFTAVQRSSQLTPFRSARGVLNLTESCSRRGDGARRQTPWKRRR